MALSALLIAIWLGIVAWRRRQQTMPGWKPLAWGAGVGLVLALILLLIDLEAQKMATRLATPLGLAWLVLFGLALDLLRNRRWWPGGLASGCWLLLSLGGNPWLAAGLLGSLERSVPAAQAQAWDAVVVLGGGTGLDNAGAVQLGSAGDRLRVGHALWRDRRTPLLIATGSGQLGSERARDLTAETAEVWRGWGVPDADMLLIPGAVNTRQEIERMANEAVRRGWKRIAIVSSAWHLPRALALARRFGLPADGVPADSRGRLPPASPAFLVPGGEALHKVQMWCTEVIGRGLQTFVWVG
jgi:uncharacterized SAM-binding protein YcdF (DUF218 family)